MSFHYYKQLDAMDCGPTCLRMIAKYYGKEFSVQQLREQSFIKRTGVNLLGLSEAAENIGQKLNIGVCSRKKELCCRSDASLSIGDYYRKKYNLYGRVARDGRDYHS